MSAVNRSARRPARSTVSGAGTAASGAPDRRAAAAVAVAVRRVARADPVAARVAARAGLGEALVRRVGRDAARVVRAGLAVARDGVAPLAARVPVVRGLRAGFFARLDAGAVFRAASARLSGVGAVVLAGGVADGGAVVGVASLVVVRATCAVVSGATVAALLGGVAFAGVAADSGAVPAPLRSGCTSLDSVAMVPPSVALLDEPLADSSMVS
jgi:hypothetical protein